MYPLMIDEAMARKYAEEVYNELLNKRLAKGGQVTFTKSLYKKMDGNSKMTIHFTEEAWQQMTSLIDEFSSEVGWYGVVNRLSDNQFEITKILVYPQTVTGVTVDTDQGEYSLWYAQQDDEDFKGMRMQAHSHVNMGVSPSSTDIDDQESMIKSRLLNPIEDDYFIFMIWNKRKEYYAKIVDFGKNAVYEKDDIQVTYDGFSCDKFIEEARKVVKIGVSAVVAGNKKGSSKQSGTGNVTYGGWGSTYGGYYGYGDEEDDDSFYDTLVRGRNSGGRNRN